MGAQIVDMHFFFAYTACDDCIFTRFDVFFKVQRRGRDTSLTPGAILRHQTVEEFQDGVGDDAERATPPAGRTVAPTAESIETYTAYKLPACDARVVAAIVLYPGAGIDHTSLVNFISLQECFFEVADVTFLVYQ